MLYLLAIFLTPLSFLVMKKWGQFVFSLLFEVLVIAGLVLGVIPGIFLWIIHVIWAVSVINSYKQQKMTGQILDAVQGEKEIAPDKAGFKLKARHLFAVLGVVLLGNFVDSYIETAAFEKRMETPAVDFSEPNNLDELYTQYLNRDDDPTFWKKFSAVKDDSVKSCGQYLIGNNEAIRQQVTYWEDADFRVYRGRQFSKLPLNPAMYRLTHGGIRNFNPRGSGSISTAISLMDDDGDIVKYNSAFGFEYLVPFTVDDEAKTIWSDCQLVDITGAKDTRTFMEEGQKGRVSKTKIMALYGNTTKWRPQ